MGDVVIIKSSESIYLSIMKKTGKTKKIIQLHHNNRSKNIGDYILYFYKKSFPCLFFGHSSMTFPFYLFLLQNLFNGLHDTTKTSKKHYNLIFLIFLKFSFHFSSPTYLIGKANSSSTLIIFFVIFTLSKTTYW